MSGLTQLSFVPSAISSVKITPSGAPFLFSELQELRLSCDSFVPISNLLARVQLPVITIFCVKTDVCPSKLDMTSLCTALRTPGIGDCITWLRVCQFRRSFVTPGADPPVLAFDDLRPSMAFRNLRHIELNLELSACFTDNDPLSVTSAWSHLEHLLINEIWGWRISSGITSNGLVRLLQTCRSLSQISLAVDTRGYMDVPLGGSPASLGLDPPPSFAINVVDSAIEAASMPAMAVFLATIMPSSSFSFRAWESWAFGLCADKTAYMKRWKEVSVWALDAVKQRSKSETG